MATLALHTHLLPEPSGEENERTGVEEVEPECDDFAFTGGSLDLLQARDMYQIGRRHVTLREPITSGDPAQPGESGNNSNKTASVVLTI